MSGIDKVKLMDSGTALFDAASREDALQKLRSALGAGTVTEEGGTLVLDFSTRRYFQFVRARLEETSLPGRYAASLQTGDSPRLLPLDLPSKEAVRRTQAILSALQG